MFTTYHTISDDIHKHFTPTNLVLFQPTMPRDSILSPVKRLLQLNFDIHAYPCIMKPLEWRHGNGWTEVAVCMKGNVHKKSAPIHDLASPHHRPDTILHEGGIVNYDHYTATVCPPHRSHLQARWSFYN